MHLVILKAFSITFISVKEAKVCAV